MIPYIPPYGRSRIAKALKPIGDDSLRIPQAIHPSPPGLLLMEDGEFLLLEDSNKIIW